ncbi:uncharacterized protein LOC120633328 [Pararge aegeria]|uniref:uncharacterized protein LOC120633328 n=1 Tax=Pararge aegeria TaxID=116150 RepID=UPI0019D044BE|nr:uncharacterized protein LOC120633328 [Pararge aegeria]
MFIMKKVIILIYLFVACLRSETVVDSDVSAQYKAEVKEEEAVLNDNDTQILNATLFKSVKKYYCRDETVDLTDAELLVYGTRAWTFPPQDVNLTLSYPSENFQRDETQEDHIDYLLTGLKVVFHLSGVDSKGYITSGGMHQDNISMTFVFRNITSLSYQFYLHGIQRSLLNITENYTTTVNLC